MDEATLQHLATSINALEAHAVEAALVHPDDSDFWPAFAAHAEPIEDCAARAGDDAHEYARVQIEEILIRLGKVDPAHRQVWSGGGS
ncbi:hypothetical protein ABU614_19765 [Lysobacter firmicutimachus]|uniref:Uncharacterized protein n=1 Tax=Lysobacter firmicutimachus TaxID=1792846 RepID=A0AAU8MTL4_9GAMM